MANNTISQRVSSPLTDEDSEFYISSDKRRKFVSTYIHNEKLNNPLYKRARCIYVFKLNESPHTYRLRGTNRRTRNYSIGILTDDNRFYYNVYKTKHTVLSMRLVVDMSKIFIDGYVLDRDTLIMLDDKIKTCSEPVAIFMHLVGKTLGVKVWRRSVETITTSLQRTLMGVPKHKQKPMRLATKRALLARNLLKKGYMDFVPKKLMDILVATNERKENPKTKTMLITAVMGILYLYRFWAYERGGKKREPYNISEHSGSNT